MIHKISRYILFKLLKWKCNVTIAERKKCIICVAPHTSNWDFVIGKLYYWAVSKKAGFLMKKNWFFFPLGIILRSMGGIPVERTKRTSLTDQLAEKAKKSAYFQIAITPEGTRSKVKVWKRGFYFIALKAKIPIQLYALDYQHKSIICTEEIYPTGNIDADMKKIMSYYQNFIGKNPEKFSIEK